MASYELTNEDLQDIEELLRISQRIKYLYDKLSLLESSLKKYTDEYIKLLDELKRTLVRENQIYTKIGDDPAK